MKYVEITAQHRSKKTIATLAEQVGAENLLFYPLPESEQQFIRFLVHDHRLQEVLDKLHIILGSQESSQVVVLAVETVMPQPEKDKDQNNKGSITASREAIYTTISANAVLDRNFLLLVLLSTIVATIGLIENNVAVIIGAMVIAPLLGPNLALSLGTALGDIALMRQSILTLVSGLILAIALAILIGFFWPEPIQGAEVMDRTKAGFDSIALAIASGAAATLSVTTGLSSVLVGVMVAVALLPPAAVMGMLLGQGDIASASGAALLLAINIVCVNLASKIVFYFKGITPRTWLEREKAGRAMRRYLLGWLVTLIIMILFILSPQSINI